MKEINKYASILLTLMTGCPEFKYWLKDNDKLELKDEMIPSWVATIHALEALLPTIKKNYPDLHRKDAPEDVDPQF